MWQNVQMLSMFAKILQNMSMGKNLQTCATKLSCAADGRLAHSRNPRTSILPEIAMYETLEKSKNRIYRADVDRRPAVGVLQRHLALHDRVEVRHLGARRLEDVRHRAMRISQLANFAICAI